MTKMSEELTKGQKLVSINFNVGGNPDVDKCKQRFADAIDQLSNKFDIKSVTELHSSIINEAEKRILDAQMWAVKALTFKD